MGGLSRTGNEIAAGWLRALLKRKPASVTLANRMARTGPGHDDERRHVPVWPVAVAA
jgi:hypothetical protein